MPEDSESKHLPEDSLAEASEPSAEPTPPAALPAIPAAEPRPARKGGIRRLITPVILLALVAVGGWFTYGWFLKSSSHEETDNAALSAHIYPVSSRVTGSVAKVLVEDNTFVHKGQLLVVLDSKDFDLNLRKAQAALEVAHRQAKSAQTTIAQAQRLHDAQVLQAQGNVSSAQAALQQLQDAITESRQGLAASQSQLKQIDVNIQRAGLELNRGKKLLAEGVTTRQQLETLQASYDGLQAQRRQAEAMIGQSRSRVAQAQDNLVRGRAQLQVTQGGLSQAQSTEAQVEVNEGQFATAEANIDQSTLAVEDARNQLSYTQIRAPEDGYVAKRAVEPGQRLQPGQTLMSVVSPSVWIVANFKETQLQRIQIGQEVEISIDAFPNQALKGKVDSLSPGTGSVFSLLPADNATGNFTKVVQRVPVKIQFEPHSLDSLRARIAPGMSATVSVDITSPARKAEAQPPRQVEKSPGRQAQTNAPNHG